MASLLHVGYSAGIIEMNVKPKHFKYIKVYFDAENILMCKSNHHFCYLNLI